MIAAISKEVRELLANDHTGLGFAHVERVCALAERLAEAEKADMQIVMLAALLHDVDDYKLFGAECAEKLINARQIMHKYAVAPACEEKVCEIIRTMGYSRALAGIRPQSLEGKIVSDADMLDAIGAVGTIRCLAYALARCETVVFDPRVFPDTEMDAATYKQAGRKSDNFINHYFEKLLRLKDMLFTDTARAEAELRHRFMIDFLREFFREHNCPEWLVYLENYMQNKGKAA